MLGYFRLSSVRRAHFWAQIFYKTGGFFILWWDSFGKNFKFGQNTPDPWAQS
jgi:hypothetical protein